VGLLYNPETPQVIELAGDRVEYFAVMPDRLWYDFGPQPQGARRFHRALGAIAEARRHSIGRVVGGHGIGLSVPSAMPLDMELLSGVSAMSDTFGRFAWYSEHLSFFITPRGTVPNAQAGLGLPVVYDDETLAIVRGKLGLMHNSLDCRILLENGSFFTPVPDQTMNEPAFLNALYESGHCGTLLDLHNLYVGWRNDGMDPEAYLEQLNPDAVEEIHLAGGDDFAGFYMDSHSGPTPDAVWEYAFKFCPRFRRLKALTFEFQETYFQRIGPSRIVEELDRMHELAACCSVIEERQYAG
jgi:uncharacterized protein (UPF0276 family)